MTGDVLRFFRNLPQQYGGVATMRLGPQPLVLVTHPDAVKHCLVDNNKNYPKNYEEPARLFGEGLLSSNGEFWLKQRRTMQPAFHMREIAGFSVTMVQAAQTLIERWSARAGQQLFILPEMLDVTQAIILRVMFSAEIGDKTREMSAAFDQFVSYFSSRMFAPLPFEWPPARRKFENAMQSLDGFINGLIETRRANMDSAPQDLLTMLLNARDPETNLGMSNKQLRDEMITLYFAGHETTASTLAWAFVFLSQSPAAEQRVRDELTQVLNGRVPTLDDYSKLIYTRRVLDEVLRLRPPAWMFTRRAIADDEVGGFAIRAGQILMFSPYATHHLTEFWPDPEKFDPDRFAPMADAVRPKHAYMPFSLGARMCIGNVFAQVEATLVLATLMQAGRMRAVTAESIKPAVGVVLRPPATLAMRFVK